MNYDFLKNYNKFFKTSKFLQNGISNSLLVLDAYHDQTGADPEVGHGGGAELWSIFLHKNYKIVHTQYTKKLNKFYITSSKFTIFGKSCQNGEKIAHFSRAPCKMLQFCRFAPEAQENFPIFSLKYGHRAIQKSGRGAEGGGLAPP